MRANGRPRPHSSPGPSLHASRSGILNLAAPPITAASKPSQSALTRRASLCARGACTNNLATTLAGQSCTCILSRQCYTTPHAVQRAVRRRRGRPCSPSTRRRRALICTEPRSVRCAAAALLGISRQPYLAASQYAIVPKERTRRTRSSLSPSSSPLSRSFKA